MTESTGIQKLIVGLGNPGRKYRDTKHNVGFAVIDELLDRLNVKRLESKCSSLVSIQKIGKKPVVLAKPMTFMNESGKVIKELVDYFKLPLDSVCIVYDDLNLELGVLRLRRSGSAGGHKGMMSIIEHLDSQNFPRLRIGIGRPTDSIDWMDYVLSEFSQSDRKMIDRSIERAADAIETFTIEGIQSALNQYNA